MFEFQLLFQRRRKVLARLMVVLLLGAAATLAILPRADAKVPAYTGDVTLLSPYPVSSVRFSQLRLPTP